MSTFKKRSQGVNASVEARDIDALAKTTGNIYEVISVAAKRTSQIAMEVRQELKAKLEEFASATDNLEEIHENKEQIEISKFYERLPNPATLAIHEYTQNMLSFRYPEDSNNRAPIDQLPAHDY
jgi:DNA-directed RNA polymerase subunit K/omega